MADGRTSGNVLQPAARWSALIALLWWLDTCGYLVPRAETPAPAELPAGAYRLDPEHDTLLLKLAGKSRIFPCVFWTTFLFEFVALSQRPNCLAAPVIVILRQSSAPDG